MSDILEYKCPCCGGAITFDSRLQKMKCPYCDTEFELDTLKEFEEETIDEDRGPSWEEENVEQSRETLEDDAGNLVSYICEACGGEIVADQNMAASRCPYCDNPVIVMKKLSGMLRPDLVIPFKLDKKQAQEHLKSHLKGKVLLPSLFKTENRIQEVKGVYVPFWLYDCDAQAEIRCRATRIHCWRSGDYQYTETQHYLVSRGGDIGFENVPVDGSVKMDDALMQSIEPFYYKDAVSFETAYLSGYLADKYDQTSAECAPHANDRMRKSTVDAFMSTILGYSSCIPEHTDIRLQQGRIRYALLPVWILHTTYKGELYTFAMNGQTGKFVGDLPADSGKAARIAGLVFAGVFSLVMLLTALF
ncbi:MAG: hypothetical protein HFG96_00135 [Lachnospiraceae bacterium]|jgi:DNA-directed RNA polymerase subunit RPC12/RpoP|nr:hypothetical protein [Lachnospiraceae bacterium]RKJ50603.1 hypothetical protein D7Y05_05400 [bacterium 1XD42-54]